MPSIKLTARFVESAGSDVDRTDINDRDARGLQLRVTKAGKKTWAFRYRRKSDGRRRRVTLGEFPGMSLEGARTAAAETRIAVQKGADPAGGVAAHKASQSFRELADDWVRLHAGPHLGAMNVKNAVGMLRRHVLPEIGDTKAADLSRRDIVRMLDKVRAAPDARAGTGARKMVARPNRVHALTLSICRWALSRGAISANPMDGLRRPIKKEKPRDRALLPLEIRTLWAALGRAPVAPRAGKGAPRRGKRVAEGDVRLTAATALALKIALATAQRIGEVTGSRWANVDLNDTAPVWIVPPDGVGAAKNREAHRVPLSPLAVRLFKEAHALAGGSDWVFPSPTGRGPVAAHAPTRAVARSRLAIGLTDWRVHDLRRTAATTMAEAGVPEFHISLVLNHVSARKGTVTGKVYNQYQYDREKREALMVLGARLEAILADAEAANVVSLFPAITETHKQNSI